MLFWLSTICFLIFVYLKIYKPHQYWKEINAPYEKPWPIVGNTMPFVLGNISIPEWLVNIYNSHKTRFFGLYEFNTPVLIIKDIELLKQIAIKEFDSFMDHRSILPDVDSDTLFTKNLLSLQGQEWRDMRSTLSPAFTGSKMRTMFNLISECAEQFGNHFAKITDHKIPLTVDLKDAYTRYTNDVIATCAFGLKCDSLEEKENEFYLMGKDATNFSGLRSLKFIGFAMIPKIMKFFKVKLFSDAVQKFFPYIIKSTIKTREENGIIRPDMIHMLMEARKGKLKNDSHDSDAGFATVEESHIGTGVKTNKIDLSDDIITAQAFIFFLAGFETSAMVSYMLSYELAVNYDIQKKLQEEIDTTLAEFNGKFTYDAILKMKYLDMVISETLRKWPPGFFTDRVCVKPFTIEPKDSTEKPVHLPKNSYLWIPTYAIHHDPEYYTNPEKFDPERFSDENKGNIKPSTYIPFGIGPRNCIGSRFALLEVKTAIVHLLSKCEIVVVEKTQIPFKFSKKEFNFASEGGYWLGLKLRK